MSLERLIRHWPFERFTELHQQLLQASSDSLVPLDLAGPAAGLGIGGEGQLHLAPAAEAPGPERRLERRMLLVAALTAGQLGVILPALAGFAQLMQSSLDEEDAVRLIPHTVGTALLAAAGLLVAGAGGGSVVSPNQTLTLSEVPVAEGGVAGSVAQVGQRVGTAIGVAGASAVFFTVLNADAAGSKLGDYHLATLGGGGLAILILFVALGFALADLGRRRKQGTS